MKTDFTFTGLIAPVFTPFLDDKTRTINYDMFDKYGHYLKTKGVQGIFVNGWTGEGMTLTFDERIKTAEVWFKVAQKYGMKMFLFLGGLPLPEMYQLAEHAERIKVDAVIVMPDFFYGKYMTVDDMANYVKDFYKYMPTRPMFHFHHYIYQYAYYQRKDMIRYLDFLDKEVPTFAGIYYHHTVLGDEVTMMKYYKPNYNHIIDTTMSVIAPFTEGFEAFSMSMLNLYPEMLVEMYEYTKNYKFSDAFQLKDKLMHYWMDYMRDSTYANKHPTYMMKMEFNKMHPDMNMGPFRMPYVTTSHMLW